MGLEDKSAKNVGKERRLDDALDQRDARISQTLKYNIYPIVIIFIWG